MSLPNSERARLGFIGGTGPEGRGLALRFAQIGHPIALGSRSEARADEAVEELRGVLPAISASAGTNLAVALDSDVVFLTIPYSALERTLPDLTDALRSKIVVSTIAPIEFQDGRPVALRIEAGSAAEEVRDSLPDSRVVSGFQSVDAHRLQNLDEQIDTDVIVCSDDVEARRFVAQLASSLTGVRGLSGGRLAASRYVEECTALLITLNRIYKAHSGVRFTGIDR